jgi:hypothetical protein
MPIAETKVIASFQAYVSKAASSEELHIGPLLVLVRWGKGAIQRVLPIQGTIASYENPRERDELIHA